MKKIRIFALLFALPFITFAQVTLTKAVHEPQPGDIAARTWYNSSGVSPGASGQGVVWDFSGIGASIFADSALYLATPTTNNDCPTLSGANLAESVNSEAFGSGQRISLFNFLKTSSSGIEYEGYCIPNTADAGPADFSNPAFVLSYPLSFSQGVSDTYSGTFYGIVALPFSGSIEVVADGEGDIILPSGDTIFNVLRVHVFDTTVAGLNLYNLWTEGWYYYEANTRFPVFTIREQPGLKEVFSSEGLLLNSRSSLGEQLSLSIYPNPAQKHAVLRFTADKPQDLDLRLYDLSGKMIRSEMLRVTTAGEQAFPMQLEGLSAGLYKIGLYDESGRIASTSLLIPE